MEQASYGFDATTGPDPKAKVPRRILGLLRAQLDALASLWTVKSATESTTTEVTTLANEFITHVREEAFRVQHRKRPADTTAGSLKAACAAVDTDKPAAVVAVVAPTAAQVDVDSQDITAGQHTQATQA